MGILTDLISGGASQLVDSVGNVLDKVVTTKEEKLQLENELKKADMDYQMEMKKLSVEERGMELKDVADARASNVAVQTSEHATTLSKNISPILALGTVLVIFTLFYILVFQSEICEKPNVKDMVIYILGILSAILAQIYSYYFGSSQGSAAKNKIISDLQASPAK